MNHQTRANPAQMTSDERTAWNTAVQLHQRVKRLQDECHDARMGGIALLDALERAEKAAHDAIRIIEGST